MADIVGKSKIYGSREEAINSLYNETQHKNGLGDYNWRPRYDGNHRFCRYYDEDGKIRTIFVIEHAPEGLSEGGVESMEVFADCEVYTFARGTSAVTSCSSSEIIETTITELETRLDECCDSGSILFFENIGDSEARIYLADEDGNQPSQDLKVFYSFDNVTFTKWSFDMLRLNPGERVYMYGDNPNGFSNVAGANEGTYNFDINGSDVAARGNVMSLIGLDMPDEIPNRACFANLFSGCTIVTAPALPATVLKPNCYAGMFQECYYLKESPYLPARTLPEMCYYEMFYQCTALTSAGDIDANTALTSSCLEMFYECTSLKIAPRMNVGTLGKSCFKSMFSNCYSLQIAPSLPAYTLAEECYDSMFINCNLLVTGPLIGASSYGVNSCRKMFYGCESLVSCGHFEEDLYLSSGSCSEMFKGCENLLNVPRIIIRSVDSASCRSMFENCTSLINIKDIVKRNIEIKPYAFHRMFAGCTNIKNAEVSLMNVWDDGCNSMFSGCTSLESIKIYIPDSGMTLNCGPDGESHPDHFWQMFSGCSNLKTVNVHSFTSGSKLNGFKFSDANRAGYPMGFCCCLMFENCVSLTAAPGLLNTHVVDDCYSRMFEGCSSLSSVRCYATAEDYEEGVFTPFGGWLTGTKTNGTFYRNANNPYPFERNTSGIPSGWTIVPESAS